MRINSRTKGKRGERKAKDVLEKWTSKEFAGVPASGGLRWKKADNISGDIICTDSLHRFDFSVEVKNYREINFEHLLMDQESKVADFWAQCKEDATRGKKLPLLMMRYDRMPTGYFFTVISIATYKRLKPILNLKPPSLYCRYHGFVIMHPDCLFTADYKQVKKLTTRFINHLYGTD
jgi:hypothetical protein